MITQSQKTVVQPQKLSSIATVLDNLKRKEAEPQKLKREEQKADELAKESTKRLNALKDIPDVIDTKALDSGVQLKNLKEDLTLSDLQYNPLIDGAKKSGNLEKEKLYTEMKLDDMVKSKIVKPITKVNYDSWEKYNVAFLENMQKYAKEKKSYGVSTPDKKLESIITNARIDKLKDKGEFTVEKHTAILEQLVKHSQNTNDKNLQNILSGEIGKVKQYKLQGMPPEQRKTTEESNVKYKTALTNLNSVEKILFEIKNDIVEEKFNNNRLKKLQNFAKKVDPKNKSSVAGRKSGNPKNGSGMSM